MPIPLLPHTWLRAAATRHFGQLLIPLLSQQPAFQLIRRTAREQWKLIALNVGSSLVEALTEGATLAVVFLAVEMLAQPAGESFNWASNPLLGLWPSAAAWMSRLPATALFAGLLALAVLLQALQSLTKFVNQVSVGYFAARCLALVTAQIHSQVLSFSFACASGYKVGDLTDYAAQGPLGIRIQIEQTSALVVGLLLSVTYLAVLVGISPWLLLAVALIGALLTLVQKRLLPRIRAGSQAVARTQAAITSRITEDFQSLRLLHSSGQLLDADQSLSSRMGELERELRAQARRLAVVLPLASFLPILAIALIAVLSLILFGARNTGVLPSLVTFVLALQRLNIRLSSMATIFNQLADNSGRLDRLNTILSHQGKMFVRVGGRPFKELRHEIRLQGVDLHYGDGGPAALNNLDLVIERGSTVALVGPSGAGKSSIADLLIGLYDPTHGRVLIDGTDLQQLDLASWQRSLGVVSQDTFMLNASLAENIAFGCARASRESIEQAARVAHADGFITALPQGYDTVVGERGYRLSGGQRQRIALARAILREPELLILDEATSALDSQNERLVQQALEDLDGAFTRLVIAHRLSTIVRADQIVVLDGGRVVQRGRHGDLLAEGGLYGELWHMQNDRTKPLPD